MRQYQQNDQGVNFNQRHNEFQMQNGNAYSMAQNYGPVPPDYQFGPVRGVPQQPFMNHRPPLQMDYLLGPSWHQGQQYDTQRMYPHMPPLNYYPHTHTWVAYYNGDPQWMTPLGHYPPYPLLLASGKTAKMLHGSYRDHLLGFFGQSMHKDVTEIFRILDSNEDWMTKTNELENRLSFEQCDNPLMGFTLRKDTVKDLAAHTFCNKKLNKEFMTKGFTLFCIQQIYDDSKMSLILHEEQMAQTMTM